MPMKICIDCGVERFTCGVAERCNSCRQIYTRRISNEKYITRLAELGYILHTDHTQISSNKLKVTVTNTACGHMFTAQLNNIVSGRCICAVCGPKKRMAHALNIFLDKYARDYDICAFHGYRDLVRKLSNINYEANIDILNPKRLVRSRPDLVEGCVNLDHIIPIIECFKRDWPAEQAAALSNLRIIDAVENLKKQRFIDDEVYI